MTRFLALQHGCHKISALHLHLPYKSVDGANLLLFLLFHCHLLGFAGMHNTMIEQDF